MARVNNPPDARAMMTTARSFGNYDLAAALADLIDNSITAEASSIEINCDYGGGEGCILRVRDNGKGMSPDDLRVAMRPASKNPEDDRSPDDLGRFGWGMKSASFSQCRILTVVTSQKGKVHGARWNLDDIDDWAMDEFDSSESQSLLTAPLKGKGTEVIWENCDRLTEGNKIEETRFNELVVSAVKKLSLIFHRYLSVEKGKGKSLKLFLNGTRIEAIDPFCLSNPATIPTAPESVKVAGQKISMQAYTLPHYSKLNRLEYEEAGGEEGYVRNQGFYVYRNRRLIIHGTWFNLAKHGELSKLVRVQVDIPNSLDEIWKITVDKSDAQLPSVLRSRMKQLIEKFRNSSSKVVRSKGARLDRGTGAVWTRSVKDGVIRFSINRNHSLVKQLRKEAGKPNAGLVDQIFKLVESQIPYDSIAVDLASKPHSVNRGFSDRDEFYVFAKKTLSILQSKFESADELLAHALTMELYSSNRSVVEEIVGELYD